MKAASILEMVIQRSEGANKKNWETGAIQHYSAALKEP